MMKWMAIPLLLVASCTGRSHDAGSGKEPVSDTTEAAEGNNANVRTLSIEEGDTLSYTEAEYAALQKAMIPPGHERILPPGTLYEQHEFFAFRDSAGKEGAINFSCESCHDDFYVTYAYFLRELNSGRNNDSVRHRLISLLRKVNNIYATMRSGGTFYGHQYRRITGIAEYAVYRGGAQSPGADYSARKKAFISDMRHRVERGVDANTDILPHEKKDVRNELLSYVDELDREIVNAFYLDEVIDFERTYYQK